MRPFGKEKLKWAVDLGVNMRGIGWNFQVKGVPPGKPNESRSAFLLRQGKGLLFGVFILDFCSWVVRRKHQNGGEGYEELSWEERFPLILAMGFQSYFGNKFQYQMMSLLAVGAGISESKVSRR